MLAAIEGQTIGTMIHPRRQRLPSRKLWIAFAQGSAGRDRRRSPARRALLENGRSLLPAGVVGVEGAFDADQAVEVVAEDGRPFAKGLVRYGATSLRRVAGARTDDLPDGSPQRGHPPRRPGGAAVARPCANVCSPSHYGSWSRCQPDPRRRPTGGGPSSRASTAGEERGTAARSDDCEGDDGSAARLRRGPPRKFGLAAPPSPNGARLGTFSEVDRTVDHYTPRMSERPAVVELGRRARAASRRLASASTSEKDAALLAAADLLLERAPEIQSANAEDLAAAEAAGFDATPLDRLRLTEARLAGMSDGLRKVAALPDPVGEVLDGSVRPNGLRIRRVRVPLGVVAIIYENRPNVTSDAARPVREVGQRRAAPGIRRGAALQRRDRRRAPGCAREDGSARGCGAPRRGRRPRDRGRGHAAHRLRRLPDPSRRPRAHPQHPRERHRPGRHRRRRELPRLRRRRRRSRPGARHRREREDQPSRRVQRGRVAASCTSRSPIEFLPRVCAALADAERRARRRRAAPGQLWPAHGRRRPRTTSAASSSR